jgi:large subunit ribosomal protein L31
VSSRHRSSPSSTTPRSHPAYAEVTVKCSCGNTFTTRSTKPGEQLIELCNECHPFYTGKQKLVDSGGRVERFNKRYGRRQEVTDAATSRDHDRSGPLRAHRGGSVVFRPGCRSPTRTPSATWSAT